METHRTSKRAAICLLASVILVAAFLGILADKNGGSLDFSDTQVRVVVSASMDGEPREGYDIETVPVKSMVFISEVPSDEEGRNAFYASLEVGDVLTFHYSHPVSHEDMVVTHRITEITEAGGVYVYKTQGDAMADDPFNGSFQIVTSGSGDVIGKVTGVSGLLGALALFGSTAQGKICLIAVPVLLLAACAALMIAGGRDDEDNNTDEGTGRC